MKIPNLMEWYKSQGEWTKIFILWAFVIIGAIFAFWILKMPIGAATGIGKLEIPKLNTTIYIPKLNMTITLVKKTPAPEYNEIDVFMCSYLYAYNITNVTLGNTTWTKYPFGNFDCVIFKV